MLVSPIPFTLPWELFFVQGSLPVPSIWYIYCQGLFLIDGNLATGWTKVAGGQAHSDLATQGTV